MSNDVIERYVSLRKELYRIEDQIEDLKKPVAEELRERGGSAVHDGYEVQLRRYVAWDYSDEITALQTELNDRKRLERETGRADIRERRDMLVLRSVSSTAMAMVGEETDFEEWEVEDTSIG